MSTESVLNRLSIALGAENDTQLSKAIGEKRSTVGNWRNRNLPAGAIIEVARRHGISLDYLFNGVIEQEVTASAVPEAIARIEPHPARRHTDGPNELVSESDLSLPVLRFLAAAPGGFLTTAQLTARLESLFNPTGQDAEILKSRTDTRFSQKVRNIVSHRDSANNPIAKGWIDYDPVRRSLRITKAGHAVLASFTFIGSIPEYKPDQPDLFGDGD